MQELTSMQLFYPIMQTWSILAKVRILLLLTKRKTINEKGKRMYLNLDLKYLQDTEIVQCLTNDEEKLCNEKMLTNSCIKCFHAYIQILNLAWIHTYSFVTINNYLLIIYKSILI